MKTTGKISALFEFNLMGNLKGIFLSAESEYDQTVLQKSLSNLLKSEKMGLVKRLFGMFSEK